MVEWPNIYEMLKQRIIIDTLISILPAGMGYKEKNYTQNSVIPIDF